MHIYYVGRTRFFPRGSRCLAAAVWLAALAGLPACVGPAATPAPAPAADSYPPEADMGLHAGRWRTPHYAVRVVAGADAGAEETTRLARSIGGWMEAGLLRYEALAGVPAGAEALPVSVYLSRRAYDEVAVDYGFPRRMTAGLTTYAGAVHTYYRATGGLDPAATLMHEGFHQYTHRALAYPTPHEVYARYPGYKRPKLPTVPLWLEEGLAMIFETASIEVDPLAPEGARQRLDGYNGPRLKQLRSLIRRRRCPPLRELMLMKLGDPLTGETYAAMWGLVYDLLRGGRMREFPIGDFLRRAETLWNVDPGEALALALREGRTERRFDAAWNRIMAERCLAGFEAILAANNLTLAEWEKGWQERMMAQ